MPAGSLPRWRRRPAPRRRPSCPVAQRGCRLHVGSGAPGEGSLPGPAAPTLLWGDWPGGTAWSEMPAPGVGVPAKLCASSVCRPPRSEREGPQVGGNPIPARACPLLGSRGCPRLLPRRAVCPPLALWMCALLGPNCPPLGVRFLVVSPPPRGPCTGVSGPWSCLDDTAKPAFWG